MAVHRYWPAHHPQAFGRATPALIISSGDVVITETVDANGRDGHGVQRAHGDNPLTGPFYVEGARPGDTLVVHIRRLAPNRAVGYSLTGLVPGAVDPAFVAELPPMTSATWHVDDRGATLVDPPTAVPVIVALRPMLGCIGVAPAHDQVLWSGTAGRHGGNMDYRGFRAGATAYFPVFVPGALLCLGDGHAAQGAGEIGGHGVEISLDVEFSVEVRDGGGVGWPRGEDERCIWTVGNARPLDQALQHATTEMLRWLRADHGYDPTVACALLAQAVDYDIGNVCDPAYSVACLLAKEHVALQAAG